MNVTRQPAVDMVAPPERLAAFRAIANGFATAYLLIRAPMFVDLGDRAAADFDPVGLFTWLEDPLPYWLVVTLLVAAIASGVASTVGWRYRITAPVFAVALLALTTLRSSWGQLLHFENLMALFAIVLAFSPAADAWSLDARRRASGATARPVPSECYGHPLVVASWIVVATYVIAGIAKLRYGGWGWIDGDTLRNHIASAAARLDLLGGTPAPLAEVAVRSGDLLVVASVLTMAVELGAPLALLDRRLRNAWVGATWLMHLGILATMAIGFPSPLFGVAFAPLFRLEVAVDRIASWIGRGEIRPTNEVIS